MAFKKKNTMNIRKTNAKISLVTICTIVMITGCAAVLPLLLF